ncbi:cerebellin-3-like [Saccostrea echinata]|uniref:cerebellin-3-like n=1 Tax=Saccostrea echinata TaxID=191078 RepID=UPI002A7EB77A|nr:cerebellin-3-like [Saccostrea echinata]
MNSTIESLKAELKQSQIERLKLSATVASLEMFRMNMTTYGRQKKVAFTVGVTFSNGGWNSGALIFPSVINNVGGGYNPTTGIFTAPIDGDYIFFLAVSEYNRQHSKVDIVMNGVSKVRTLGSSGSAYQTGVNMVFLQLNERDAVWARAYAGRGYNTEGVPITTFSGFLL